MQATLLSRLTRRSLNLRRLGVLLLAFGLTIGLCGLGAVSLGQVSAGGGAGSFFGLPSGGAFDPVPTAVFSGHTLHLGATVSSDRKYVNLNGAADQMSIIGVQSFPVFSGGGFVGSGPAAIGAVSLRPPIDPGLKGSDPNPTVLVAGGPPLSGVLANHGMTRVGNVD